MNVIWERSLLPNLSSVIIETMVLKTFEDILAFEDEMIVVEVFLKNVIVKLYVVNDLETMICFFNFQDIRAL